jgi:hypothetical protein
MTTETNAEDFTTAWRKYEEAIARANTINKAPVFEALRAAGITDVTVDFDGGGDSGQIESLVAFQGETPTGLPEIKVPQVSAEWGLSDLISAEISLERAIEDLCYGYLQQTNAGWENNDGAYGEFTFDIAEGTIELDFNARFTDSASTLYTL